MERVRPDHWFGLDDGPYLSPKAGECFRVLARHTPRGCERPYEVDVLGAKYWVWSASVAGGNFDEARHVFEK